MTRTPTAHLRAEEMSGIYWTPPTPATSAEIDPMLMVIVMSKPNYSEWSIYSANVFDMSSGAPLGSFDMALDPTSDRACGYYSSIASNPTHSSPTWFASSGDINNVMRDFHRILREAGHVE